MPPCYKCACSYEEGLASTEITFIWRRPGIKAMSSSWGLGSLSHMCVDPHIWSVESVAYLLHTRTGNTRTVWTSFCTRENYIPSIFFFFKIGIISPKLASRDDLKLKNFLRPLPKCWNCRCVLTHKVSSISENQDKDLEYGRQALHTATTPDSSRNFDHAMVMLRSGILFWDILPNHWMTCFWRTSPDL